MTADRPKLTRSGFRLEDQHPVLAAYNVAIPVLCASSPVVLARRLRVLSAVLLEQAGRISGRDFESEAIATVSDDLTSLIADHYWPADWKPGDE